MALISVLFPAPFGPMTPLISPASMAMCTSCSAARPRKYMLTPCTTKNVITCPSTLFPQERGQEESLCVGLHLFEARQEPGLTEMLLFPGGEMFQGVGLL